MDELNNEAGATNFPISMYVPIIPYLAQVLVQYAYLIDILSIMHVVKLVSVCVMLHSVIKLALKK
jgi:hypothetical protein